MKLSGGESTQATYRRLNEPADPRPRKKLLGVLGKEVENLSSYVYKRLVCEPSVSHVPPPPLLLLLSSVAGMHRVVVCSNARGLF